MKRSTRKTNKLKTANSQTKHGVKITALTGVIRNHWRMHQMAMPYRFHENALDRYKDFIVLSPQTKKEKYENVSRKALTYVATKRIKQLAQPRITYM